MRIHQTLRAHQPQAVAPNATITPDARQVGQRDVHPKAIEIRPAFDQRHVQHPVVLAQQVKITTGREPPAQLCEHTREIRHRLRDMPAHHEIEASVRLLECECICLAETHASGQLW